MASPERYYDGCLSLIVAATDKLLASAARFGDADVREPSLLPGWSRAHVLTHLARNADGGARLLRWARTGVETPEYPSMRARDEEIEAGSGRGATELIDDLRASAARFAAEYTRMPPEAWQRVIRWTGGQTHPAHRAADSRLTEVLVHHVDLRADFTPEHWPGAFADDMLGRVAGAFSRRDGALSFRLHATDTGTWYQVGKSESPVVEGPRNWLLAWMMGRSQGDHLTAAELPALPFLY